MIKKIFENIGYHISFPLNPWFVSSIGLFGIFWSFYLYIPKQMLPLKTSTLFLDYYVREVLFVFAFFVGTWLFSVPFWSRQGVQKMVLPLRIYSVFWLSVAAFIFLGNWTSTNILTYIFLSFFCIVSAANFSVNRDHPEYRNIFKSTH